MCANRLPFKLHYEGQCFSCSCQFIQVVHNHMNCLSIGKQLMNKETYFIGNWNLASKKNATINMQRRLGYFVVEVKNPFSRKMRVSYTNLECYRRSLSNRDIPSVIVGGCLTEIQFFQIHYDKQEGNLWLYVRAIQSQFPNECD